ncbi:PREDICTED: peroxidase 69-like [Camelina sativa]|uniref:Peroxidase n=1 Tax=Camelina sativa TaxID=90675 RepID=A0ABM0VUS9_CAMSA|nr:PREDICTED: peroxidase 69-like [Camelina sativa]
MGRGYTLLFVLVTFLVLVAAVTAQGNSVSNRGGGRRPRVGFYGNRCRNVESIVRSVVKSHVQSNPANAPGLLRMHFHDCFVRGCDASILLAGNTSERTAGPNRSLRGFEVIEEAKTRLELACPRTVSCADILTLATRDAVVLSGGQSWKVPLGRLDGRISQASDVNLPGPSDPVSKQKQDFAAKTLNTLDLVTLVGGHTIGTAGCGLVRGRFFNFNGTGQPDPSIDPSFVPLIQARCPQTGGTRVELDAGSVDRFDTSFLRNVRSSRVVLQSDLVLWKDTETRVIIERLLGLRRPSLRFGTEFGKSMVKMSLIEVKTGSDGEIRRVCSAIN